MRRTWISIISVSIIMMIGSFAVYVVPLVQANEVEDIQKEIDHIKDLYEQVKDATENNEQALYNINERIKGVEISIDALRRSIERKKKEVAKGEKNLKEQRWTLYERVKSDYKQGTKQHMNILSIVTGDDLQNSAQLLFYHQRLIQQDRRSINTIIEDIEAIEQKKKELEYEQKGMANLQQQLNTDSVFLAQEVEKSRKHEQELQQKIAELSAQQQQLIAQKLSSLNLPQSLGSGPLICEDDRKLNPGFGNAYAFFTFGIPHRVGMNQYGALGRAQAGQDFRAILNAYYNNISIECRGTNNNTITVQGYGEMSTEEYLKGIYEIPNDWPIEAIKAQVVAARSYALTYTNNGEKEICTTQACQVYKGGNKGGQWEQAVNETGAGACSDGQGLVAISNDTGGTITGWFASTFGGYTLTSGEVWGSQKPWTKRMQDTSSPANSLSELFEKAYDKDSPCFYAAHGWREQYGNSAWLKGEEVADIANALLLAKRDASTQTHLSQVDKENPDGTDTWDAEKVKSELKSRGGSPFNNVTNVSASIDVQSGRTTGITISGDGGSHTFDGGEFKNFFNLRAPANIQIVGPMYNVETK